MSASITSNGREPSPWYAIEAGAVATDLGVAPHPGLGAGEAAKQLRSQSTSPLLGGMRWHTE
jgi:hypothetical protein